MQASYSETVFLFKILNCQDRLFIWAIAYTKFMYLDLFTASLKVKIAMEDLCIKVKFTFRTCVWYLPSFYVGLSIFMLYKNTWDKIHKILEDSKAYFWQELKKFRLFYKVKTDVLGIFTEIGINFQGFQNHFSLSHVDPI